MNTEAIREWLDRSPFEPFLSSVSNGQTFQVNPASVGAMGRTMKPIYAVVIVMAAWTLQLTSQVSAQCCLGTQDISRESTNGRYKVEATTLNGKGHHGPFHYRFTTLAKNADGKFEKVDAFEKKWDHQGHFNMKLMVSPIGNGFAVAFPINRLAFFRPDGLQTYFLNTDTKGDPRKPGIVPDGVSLEELLEENRDFELTENGFNVAICQAVYLNNAGCFIEDSSVFLPLGLEANKHLSAQLIWYLHANPADFKREREFIAGRLAEAQDTANAEGARAWKDIQVYGFLSIPVIQQALNESPNGANAARWNDLMKQLTPWLPYAGESGWRDLDLIDAAMFYPDTIIQKKARQKLTSLIDAPLENLSAGDVHRWLIENRAKLKWRPDANQYILSK